MLRKGILTSVFVSLLLIIMGQQDCEGNERFEIYQQNIEKLNQSLSSCSNSEGGKIYVTVLPFIDGMTKSSCFSSGDLKLIDDFVERGLNELQKINPALVVNQSGHIVKSSDRNINRLIDIIFDPGLTKDEKMDKIIDEIMTPNQVDIILAGYCIEEANNPCLSLKPLVIIKSNKKILTKNLQFFKQSLFCKEPVSDRTIICRDAYDMLSQVYLEFLTQL